MALPRYDSQAVDKTALSKPLRFEFANRLAPNRFLKAAMTERLSSWDPDKLEARGIPSKSIHTLYKRWGEGVIGTITTGNIMLEYDQIATAGDLVVPRDAPFHGDRFEAFSELARVGQLRGSLMIGQLNHPGRQVDQRIQANPISASNLHQERTPLGFVAAEPRAATADDIDSVVDAFAHAAEYLERAGFDGVELLGGHGYLLAQFLSSSTNLRTDRYGGSITNRARLITEIAQAIRARTKPSFVLGIKLNSVEFQSSGLQLEEAKILCTLLEANRFDFVELSGGTLEDFGHKRESTKQREGFFMEFADLIAPMLTKTKVFVTGGFKTVGGMVKALERVDGVGIARPFAQEPWLARDLLAGSIKGAIKQRPDENNYGLTNVIAGSQIGRIGAGLDPIIMSEEENEKAFASAMEIWMEEASNDTRMSSYGYVKI